MLETWFLWFSKTVYLDNFQKNRWSEPSPTRTCLISATFAMCLPLRLVEATESPKWLCKMVHMLFPTFLEHTKLEKILAGQDNRLIHGKTLNFVLIWRYASILAPTVYFFQLLHFFSWENTFSQWGKFLEPRLDSDIPSSRTGLLLLYVLKDICIESACRRSSRTHPVHGSEFQYLLADCEKMNRIWLLGLALRHTECEEILQMNN